MYLLVDIGATNTRLAVSRDEKSIGDPLIIPTNQNFKKAIGELRDTAKKLTSRKIKKVVVGAPGPFNKEKNKIVGSQNLPHWNGCPLKGALRRSLRVPVVLENDSALVGLGETVFGAGKGKSIVAYITVSTGVGGVKIVNGKINDNAFGFEPGGQIIDYRHNKTLEDLISGSAIEEKYHKKPYEIKSKKFWKDMAKILAFGLNNVVVHWSPEIIVIGGSVMKKIPIPDTSRYLKQILSGYGYKHFPLVKKAKLGNFGGLYGGLALLKNKKI